MPIRKREAPKRNVQRTYWPNCTVCQFMKAHKDFRYRVMQSTYFNPNGTESFAEVIHAFGDPFILSTAYAHMRRHQQKDLKKAQEQFEIYHEKTGVTPDATLMVEAVEGDVVKSSGTHELGLDEFIRDGRAKLAAGEMTISATTYLQAIKIKADIEKSTKDRRLDAMKALFKGAAPKSDET